MGRRKCLAIIILVTFSGWVWATCVSTNRSHGSLVGYDSIQLIPMGDWPSNQTYILNKAMEMWNRPECNPGGISFPYLRLQPGGLSRQIAVYWNQGPSSENPARCGTFAGNQINLFERALINGNMTLCSYNADRMAESLAHEIGHLFGLQDQADSATCGSFIMSNVHPFSNGTIKQRYVTLAECQMVASTSKTPTEKQIEEQEACEADPNCTLGGLPGQTSEPTHLGLWTPIVLDLDGDSFHFSGLDLPVAFDLDADGIKETIGWSQAQTSDAFLVWDRNENGVIDDGGELFGNATFLSDGLTRAKHGYEALAEIDGRGQGGNYNGFIDPADRHFDSLSLWTDKNHDGISQADELEPLHAWGIERLGLSYVMNQRRDPHGNLLRYQSWAWKQGQPSRIRVVDVIFVMSDRE